MGWCGVGQGPTDSQARGWRSCKCLKRCRRKCVDRQCHHQCGTCEERMRQRFHVLKHPSTSWTRQTHTSRCIFCSRPAPGVGVFLRFGHHHLRDVAIRSLRATHAKIVTDPRASRTGPAIPMARLAGPAANPLMPRPGYRSAFRTRDRQHKSASRPGTHPRYRA